MFKEIYLANLLDIEGEMSMQSFEYTKNDFYTLESTYFSDMVKTRHQAKPKLGIIYQI